MTRILTYILPAIALLLLFSKRKKSKSTIHEAFYMMLKLKANRNILRRVEQIYKLETANFSSNIYRKTYGAGAIATSEKYPYGFKWLRKTDVKTCGLYHSKNGFDYIKFCTLLDGLKFLYYYLCLGNVDERTQKWGSVDGYLQNVKKIKNTYV